MSSKMDVVVDAANALGEGVVWSPRTAKSSGPTFSAAASFLIAPRTAPCARSALPDRLACFAPLGGLLCSRASPAVSRSSTLRAARAGRSPPSSRTARRRALNDGKLDRRGRLVFGTMDEDPGRQPIGQVYSYDGGASPRALISGVRISNSIAFSPDGRRMYFADTPTKVIRCYDYDPDSGDVSGERTFAEVQGPGAPDGSTVDADGCLWNAEWGGGRVVRYTPDGRVDRAIALPCAQVTCCAFGGAELDQLFVTTARTGLDAAALAGQPQAGALFVIDAGVVGLARYPVPPGASFV